VAEPHNKQLRAGPKLTTRIASLLILGAVVMDQAQAQRPPPTQPAVVTVSIGGEEITLRAKEPPIDSPRRDAH